MAEEIRIVSSAELESGPPTGGMTRKTAVAGDDVWMGEVRTEPGVMSGWHHHGEHTTYGYVIDGKVRVEFGPGGSSSLEGSAGDFFVVPRDDDDLADYGLDPLLIGDSLISSTDIIRRRWLDNDFYGFTYALNYDKDD
jgi:hypothetical protein